MKKTILKSFLFATVATLGTSGAVWAHHPLSIVNPEQFEVVDAMINDTHNELIGDVEDFEFMATASQSAGAETSQAAAMGDAVEQSSSNVGVTGSAMPATNLTGISAQSMARGAGGARAGR